MASTAHEPTALIQDAIERILVVEDNHAYAALLTGLLDETWGAALDVVHVDRLEHARAQVGQAPFDCILLDLTLPDGHGLETVRIMRSFAADLPLVVLSGADDEAVAVGALKNGAQDYLVKARADRDTIARSIRYAIERKHGELAIVHQATRDPLTGLPNRTLFMDRLDQALARTRRSGGLLAVMFMDLDGFKTINDSLGHDAGDQVLVDIAARLSHAVRPVDTIARFGGDEFVVLCEDLAEAADAEMIALRLRQALADGSEVGGRRLPLSASLGIALDHTGTVAAGDLLRNADTAMYEAKATIGFTHRLFEHAMHVAVRSRLAVETELERAVEHRQLRLEYQPQVDVVTGRVTCVEALIRWEHPDRGVLLPGAFIEHAERTGVIAHVGAWVIDEACRQLAEWQARHPTTTGLCVSVNVAAAQLADGRLPEIVQGALARSGLPADRLVVELTERAYLDAAGATRESVVSLAEAGCTIAVDDFGTGFAALSMLADFPIATLKTDRAFARSIAGDRRSRALLDGITRLASCLDIAVVAEGIETTGQFDVVRQLGIGEAQGFLFARPQPPGRFDRARLEAIDHPTLWSSSA